MSTSKPFHHGDLRKELVSVAREVIETDGIDALSLRGVARQAGVSTAAPYRHFDSKEKLLAEVARQGFEDLHDALDRGGQSPDPFQSLLDQSMAYLGFAMANPRLYRLMFASHIDKTKHPDLMEAGERTFAVLQARFDPATDPHAAARAIGCWGLVHGLASLAIDNQLDAHVQTDGGPHMRAILEPLVRALMAH